jgi:hypothetical protein
MTEPTGSTEAGHTTEPRIFIIVQRQVIGQNVLTRREIDLTLWLKHRPLTMLGVEIDAMLQEVFYARGPLGMSDTELLDALDRWAREHEAAFEVGTFGHESDGGIVVNPFPANPFPSRRANIRTVIRAFLDSSPLVYPRET